MPSHVEALARRVEALLLLLVVVVGAVGVALPGPARTIDGAGAINPTLGVLVLTAGMTVDVSGLRHIRRRWARVVTTVVTTSLVLPALAWAVSHLVSGPPHDGVLAIGVAPSEVASLGLVAVAGGETAVAAVLLVSSSILTVLAGGPVLALLSGPPSVHSGGLTATLVLVVALPLALGVVLGRMLSAVPRVLGAGRLLGVLSLLVLLWEVAGEVELRARYLGVVAAMVLFIVGAAVLGRLLTLGLPATARTGVLLPVAMRDFAVAAGLASNAFGARAVGPLGIYGFLVLVTGAVAVHSPVAAHAPGVPDET